MSKKRELMCGWMVFCFSKISPYHQCRQNFKSLSRIKSVKLWMDMAILKNG